MELSSDADVDGRAFTIVASATRDTTTRRVTALAANLEIADADEAKAAGLKTGAIALKLAGSEGSGENASRLTASLSLAGSEIAAGRMPGRAHPVSADLSHYVGMLRRHWWCCC